MTPGQNEAFARIPPGASDGLKQILLAFKRQALHAAKLGLIHPATGKKLHWSAPVPQDMAALLRALAKDARAHGG